MQQLRAHAASALVICHLPPVPARRPPRSVRYCRSLEEGSFRGRPADFFMCLLFGMCMLLSIAPWVDVMFFGASLTFMLVYIWSKRNPGVQIR